MKNLLIISMPFQKLLIMWPLKIVAVREQNNEYKPSQTSGNFEPFPLSLPRYTYEGSTYQRDAMTQSSLLVLALTLTHTHTHFLQFVWQWQAVQGSHFHTKHSREGEHKGG